MSKPVPAIAPDELAIRLDRGEALQVLDIRSPDRVHRGQIGLGQALDFHSLANPRLLGSQTPAQLGLDPRRPVAVVCGHGNSSQRATLYLRGLGLEAYSVQGGMAAWEGVYVPRTLAPTRTIDAAVQLDRVGKGALSYVLASDGAAVVVDPGRHVERYDALLRQLDARPVAVIDTHMHADYLSGGRGAAARWHVPYHVFAADAVSPFDGTPGRLSYTPLADGARVAFGRAALRVAHTPGHTLGSITLLSDDGLALTGDFVFVQSVGRPDLGGHPTEWAQLLWTSLERARATWAGDLLILPAHYAAETERRADRTVAARWDVITATNQAFAPRSRAAFLAWIAAHAATPPDAYGTIKLANLGLVDLTEAQAEVLESGPNVCAV
jgi:glyoxylase-like metal-dependent hydrolase (beta-lactamase superfamily II)/rhodanese-related sulfurtransferase